MRLPNWYTGTAWHTLPGNFRAKSARISRSGGFPAVSANQDLTGHCLRRRDGRRIVPHSRPVALPFWQTDRATPQPLGAIPAAACHSCVETLLAPAGRSVQNKLLGTAPE